MRVESRIREVAEGRGVPNAFHLWQRIGGSKETAYQLWAGEFKMVGLHTLASLCEAIGCTVGELLIAVPDTRGKGRGGKKTSKR